MYPPFKNLVHKVLSDNQITITFVDIGSRNGITELVALAEFVNAYGFEPNPVEYEKLLTGKTDASLLGQKIPNYKTIKYSPYALADFNGMADFYITKGPGACGMLEPDLEHLREFHFRDTKFAQNFGDDVFKVEKVIKTPVKTLLGFSKENNLNHIDYLKIDVEGSEYEALRGAGDLLKNTGVIKAEVCFLPFRKNQRQFSEIDLLLRSFGFELLKYEAVPSQIGFKEREASWSFYPSVGVPEKFGKLMQADAVYINRNLKDKQRILAQVAVLIEKNYLDEALFILKRKTNLDFPGLMNLLKTYPGSVRDRALRFFFNVLRAIRSL